ncbi:MAG: hypothetical protein AB7P21_06670 [Lautropia sp.]
MQESEARLFGFRSEFQACVAELIGRTRYALAISDHDLSDWSLEQSGAVAQLERILLAPQAAVRILVRDTEFLEKHAPRLLALRKRHAAALSIRQVPASIASDEGLMLGDTTHVLRRAHHDAFRGRVQFAMPAEAEPWRRKFDASWAESQECLAATTLGL